MNIRDAWRRILGHLESIGADLNRDLEPVSAPRMRLVLPETASTRYFEVIRSIGPSERLARAVDAAERVRVVTDAERIALYGTCATCGAPVDCFDLEFRDGDRFDMLLCLEHPMEHPA